MDGFNTTYILEKIADMGDGVNSMSDIFKSGMIPEDAPQELRDLAEVAGIVIGMDYADLGEKGYDAYGIYSFLPDNEDDVCRILSMVITLSDNIQSVGIYDMYQIINRVNVRIPCGAFVLSDDEKTLYYRNYSALPKLTCDDETLHNVGLRIFDSISCVTDWIDVLMGLNEGSMSYEDCIARLNDFYEQV